MALQINTILIFNTAQVLSTPDVDNIKVVAILQLGDFTPNRGPGGREPVRVEHQHNSPIKGGRRTGPVFRWMFSIERVVLVVSPLVRIGRPANPWVLVEVKQILILEDCKVVLVELSKLHNVRQ